MSCYGFYLRLDYHIPLVQPGEVVAVAREASGTRVAGVLDDLGNPGRIGWKRRSFATTSVWWRIRAAPALQMPATDPFALRRIATRVREGLIYMIIRGTDATLNVRRET